MTKYAAVFRHTYINSTSGEDVAPEYLERSLNALQLKLGQGPISARVFASDSWDASHTAGLVAARFGVAVEPDKFSTYPHTTADLTAVIDAMKVGSPVDLSVFVTHKEMTSSVVRNFCRTQLGLEWSGLHLDKSEVYLVGVADKEVWRCNHWLLTDSTEVRIEVAEWLANQGESAVADDIRIGLVPFKVFPVIKAAMDRASRARTYRESEGYRKWVKILSRDSSPTF